MTVYRLPIFRGLPPTAEFWATYVGRGDPERYPLVGLVLHFLYGGVGGGMFGVVLDRVEFESARDQRIGGTLFALAYGAALSVFGTRVLFPVLLDEELDSEDRLVFHVGHVIYGLTLGTWLSAETRLGNIYE